MTEIFEKFHIDLASARRQDNRPIQWKVESNVYATWLISKTTGLVYERKSAPQNWKTWAPHHNRARYMTRSNFHTLKEHTTVDSILNDAIPISITRKNGRLTLMAMQEKCPADHTRSQIRHDSVRLTSKTGQNSDSFSTIIILDNGIIFSDGSYNKHKAAYAIAAQPKGSWQSLDALDLEHILHYSGLLVDGSGWDLNSYHAELRGILATIEFTNKVCMENGVTRWQCTL